MQESNNWLSHKILAAPGVDFSRLLFSLDKFDIEGIEEIDLGLNLYYRGNLMTEPIKTLCSLLSLDCVHEISIEKPTNWNAIWESSFDPVRVSDFCIIYAHFHQIIPANFLYNIQITPQMSFGTGHHETTRLMMLQMRSLNWSEKKVFDFGSGTGILAILAEMMGAKEIIGVDNMTWAVENSIQNAEENKCQRIQFSQADHAHLPGMIFDIVLVNIIRKVILDNLDTLRDQVTEGGYLLLSGFLKNDAQKMIYEVQKRQFSLVNQTNENKWVCQLYQKNAVT